MSQTFCSVCRQGGHNKRTCELNCPYSPRDTYNGVKYPEQTKTRKVEKPKELTATFPLKKGKYRHYFMGYRITIKVRKI